MSEFFNEQSQWADLWKQAFSGVEAEWDLISEYNWNFSNLQDAFEECGVLHGEDKLFLFGCTETQLLYFGGQSKAIAIPVVVVVVSPSPPSDKIGIASVQTKSEEIIDMENIDMGWVPYVPLGERGSSVERLLPQVFILSRVQREAASERFEFDPSVHFCVPYFNNPFKVDETEQSTVVDILYTTEATTTACCFDWQLYELEELTNELIAHGELSRDHEDTFKVFVKEKVQEVKRANHETMRKRLQAQEELRAEGKAVAYEKIKLYKFYPVATPNTPDVSHCKASYINRYYGKAHQVF